MKKATTLVLAVLLIVAGMALGIIYAVNHSADAKVQHEDNFGPSGGKYTWKLPESLDKYYPDAPYKNKSLSPFAGSMFAMTTPMEGIAVNTVEGDKENATKSFYAFASEYENSSKMVPEWRSYYDMTALHNLGFAVKSGKPGPIFAGLTEIGKTCDTCHEQNSPHVWAKYYWPSFDTINISTVNPNEPTLPWVDAKQKYLATGFEGIEINLQKGDTAAAMQSYNQFRAMFLNLKEACKQCHDTERKYFVSDDVMALVDSIPGNMSNPPALGEIMGKIGNNCYECHILHQPAQFTKDLERSGESNK